MAVYDQEKTDDLNSLTGINKADEKAIEARAHDTPSSLTPDQIANEEKGANSPNTTTSSQAENQAFGEGGKFGSSDDQIGNGYSSGGAAGKVGGAVLDTVAPQLRFAGRIKKRRGALALVLVGLFTGGTLGISTIISGPLQFIHLSQYLQRAHYLINEETADSRVGKLIVNARKAPQNRRLGAASRVVAEQIDARLRSQSGLAYRYDNAGRFQGLEVIDINKPGARKLAELGYSADFDQESGRNIFRADSTARFQNGANRQLSGAALEAAEFKGITGSIANRVMNTRNNTSFKLFGNIRRDAGDTVNDYRSKIRDGFEEHVRRGNPYGGDITLGIDEDGDGINDTDVDGNSVEGEPEDLINELGLDADIDNPDTQGIKNSILGSVGGEAGGAVTELAIGLVCAANAIGDNFDDDLYDKVVLPMMRLGSAYTSMGDQVASARGLDYIEMAEASESFYDEADGTGWAAASSIQYEQGRAPTGPDIPDYASPVQKTNGVIKFISDIPGINPFCLTLGNPFVSGILAGTEAVFSPGSAIIGLLSGPAISSLVDTIIGRFVLRGVSSLVAGAAFGNIANYGTRLTANDSAIASGGVLFSPEEQTAWDNTKKDLKEARIAKMSTFDKLIDLKSNDSLASTLLIHNNYSASVFAKNNLANPFLSTVSSFANFFNNKVSAQEDHEYEYGFGEFGFSQDLLESPAFEDPFKNEVNMEQSIAVLRGLEADCENGVPEWEYFGCDQQHSSINELNGGDSDYGWCQGDANDPEGTIISGGPGNPTEPYECEEPGPGNPEESYRYGAMCFGTTMESNKLTYSDTVNIFDENEYKSDLCATGGNPWTQYRVLMLDMTIEPASACFYGDTESCAKIGSTAGNVQGSNASAVTIEGFTFPLLTNKSSVGNRGIFSNNTTTGGHPYSPYAYDIYVPKDTPVVSVEDGVVSRINNNSNGVALSVQVYNESENRVFFYQHLEPGSAKVSEGQFVQAGQELGLIGGYAASFSTVEHLHIDAMRGNRRLGCSRASCSASARALFLDIGPQLYQTYQLLDE